MAFLSVIFYFLGYHPFLAMLALLLGGLIVSAVMAQLGGHRAWFALLIPIFVFTQINFFTGHMLNALFLNAFGTQGHAVIVHSRETDSQLNDKNIWEYDAVLRTADGHDVPLQFNTMSAAIYPIRNAILIPPENQMFMAKYIPGFERNLVIMSDESDYGKRIIMDDDKGPVEKAAGQYAVSPTNPAFIKEYRDALQAFIAKHRSDADPDLIQDYEQQLERLGGAN